MMSVTAFAAVDAKARLLKGVLLRPSPLDVAFCTYQTRLVIVKSTKPGVTLSCPSASVIVY